MTASGASTDENHIDARGLICPQPLLLVRRRVQSLRPGTEITIIADDPQADLDLEVWSYRQGHSLTDKVFSDGLWTFRVTLGGGPSAE